MRVQEFLIEYNLAVTVRNFGQKVAKVARRDKTVPIDYRSRQVDDKLLVELVIFDFEQQDPTPKKDYVPWLTKAYATGVSSFEEIKSTATVTLHKFQQLKNHKMLPSPRNDIMKYDNFADLVGVLQEYPDAEEIPSNRGQSITVYSDEVLTAVVPLDQNSACRYGKGTKWCTASIRSNMNRFNDYSAAPLLILIPKKPEHPSEKYQLWFFYGTNEDLFTSDANWLYYFNKYGKDYQPEYGQFTNDANIQVDLKMISNRFDISFFNAVSALAKRYPKLQYAITKNYENAKIS